MKYLQNALLLIATLLMMASAQAQRHSKITYIHSDPDGTPIAATDEQGNLEWRVEYQPFGREVANTSQDRSSDISYAAKPYDEEIGLSYFGGRWYDPDSGRFTGIDPMPVQFDDYRTFNRYAFTFNNPYKYYDPDGRFAFLIPLAVFVAKEVAAEGASRLTHGATDFLSFRRVATNGGKLAFKKFKSIDGAGVEGVSKGGKPDFIVDTNGTAVRNSASGARKDLEAGGFKGSPTTETLENGTLHKGVLGRDGLMDVRIMDGQVGGGPFKGPRIRTTRGGTGNEGVRSDGSIFRNNESKSQRLAESHIHLGEK